MPAVWLVKFERDVKNALCSYEPKQTTVSLPPKPYAYST
jgi:hypothetical protein